MLLNIHLKQELDNILGSYRISCKIKHEKMRRLDE